MKYVFSLIALAVSFHSFGQKIESEILPDKGSYEFDRYAVDDHLRVETEVWAEDFSDGIPADWTNVNYNVNYNGNSQITQAKWEYRGPSTDPDNTLGTVGNCIDENLEGGPTIFSPTKDNGFLIFDSDYWDSNEGSCIDFGTGFSPAPHNAQLTTGSIDLSGTPYVGLIFNQFAKNFQSTFKVQASVNDGEFTDVFVNDIAPDNGITDEDMQIRKNISSTIGGQSNVKLRFVFEGTYYYWMIDDVKLVELQANNMELSNARHGSLIIQSFEAFETFEGMEYYIYPVQMPTTLDLSATAKNLGAIPQTDVKLEVTLLQGVTELTSKESETEDIAPDASEILETADIMLPTTVGEYTLSYAITQTEMEDAPDDNVFERAITVSPTTIGRDEGTTDAFYIPDSENLEDQYEVGTVYVPTVDNLQVYSISGAVGEETLTGSQCYASLYGISASQGVIIDPIATSSLVTVQSFHLNSFGDEQMMVFNFNEPIDLVEDSSYLAVIGTINTPEQVRFSVSGQSQPGTSWVKYSDNTIRYLERTPMVRMNFDVVTAIESTLGSAPLAVNLFPNPASEKLAIEYNLTGTSDLDIDLFDVQGRHLETLFSGRKAQGIHQINVDISTLAAGTYLIRLNSQFGRLEETLVIE